jgi:hypothetical protein
MGRKLASVQKILNIEPIPDADFIEKAVVLGWECVVAKRDNLKIGDLVIYIEVDSIVPPKPEFEFLKERKYRVRTIKLKKTTSQGLILPLSILPNKKYNEGDDLTSFLQIRKYDPQADLELKLAEEARQKSKNKIDKFLMKYPWYRKLFFKPKRGGWPKIFPKTDETRLQNIPDIIEEEKNTIFTVTEKLDGCLDRNTKITTEKGEIEIYKLVKDRMNVRVLSYNEKKDILEYKNILDYHKISSKNKIIYKINFSLKPNGVRTNNIICTSNHKFLTKRGWIEAEKLNDGDFILHNNIVISDDISEMLLGCLIGDSHIVQEINKSSYKTIGFTQGEKQYDYLMFKMKLLETLWNKKLQKGKSGFSNNIVYSTTLMQNDNIENVLNSMCLKDNKKYVTEAWANALSPLSLAFWYMDDGTLRNRNSDNLQERASFCSNSLSLDECIFLQKRLSYFNITSSINKNKKYYNIDLTADGTSKLFEIIHKYVPVSMRYKISKKYENGNCELDDIVFKTKNYLLERKINKIEKINKKYFYLYDLTIQDNSNYFANKILVHNCSASYFLIKKNKKFLWFNLGKTFEFGVCSRNLYLPKENDGSYWSIARKYNLKKVLENIIGDADWVAIQGEILGTNIQGNKYKVTEYEMYAFNLIYSDKKLDNLIASEILKKEGIKFVPLLDNNFKLLPSISENVNYAKGKSVIADSLREGVVVRNYEKGLSFKIINPEFLLKFEE